ncbi:unnamed protein product, partial [Soboliphyme baturini]|uniref:CASP-like protein n=1 Tax=Soboliphyme baturini TaxID=241478 RepID=A0A183ITT5_9BILA
TVSGWIVTILAFRTSFDGSDQQDGHVIEIVSGSLHSLAGAGQLSSVVASRDAKAASGQDNQACTTCVYHCGASCDVHVGRLSFVSIVGALPKKKYPRQDRLVVVVVVVGRSVGRSVGGLASFGCSRCRRHRHDGDELLRLSNGDNRALRQRDIEGTSRVARLFFRSVVSVLGPVGRDERLPMTWVRWTAVTSLLLILMQCRWPVLAAAVRQVQNITRVFNSGDLFTNPDVNCRPMHCAVFGAHAARTSGCSCQCPLGRPAFLQHVMKCSDEIRDCRALPFGTNSESGAGGGGVSQKLPIVFLPLTGQILNPSLPPNWEAAPCIVFSVGFLTYSGWSTMENAALFSLLNSNGYTYIQVNALFDFAQDPSFLSNICLRLRICLLGSSLHFALGEPPSRCSP